MVDALKRAGRVAAGGGPVIAIQPTPEPAHVEIQTPAGIIAAGDLTDDGTPLGPARRHADADRAIAALVDQGTCALDARREFAFHRYADSLADLQDFLTTRTHSWLSAGVARRAEALLGADATASLRLRERATISRLRFDRGKTAGAQ
jgi:hypothetical protein